MSVRVAVGQFAAGTDKAANLAAVAGLVHDAATAGASIAVLPENSMYSDATPGAEARAWAEPLDGPFARELSRLARTAGLTVVAGMTESVPRDARASNTLLAVSETGEQLGVYRKVHLYDAFGYRESDRIKPAAHATPLTFACDGISFGAMTCYDLRFPEMARRLVDAGADALLLPAAWVAGPAKEDHWVTLARARAIENTAWMLAAGQTGPVCAGQSMIVDPMGVVLASAGEAPGIAVAELDQARLEKVRQSNPSLTNRRFTVIPIEEPVPAARRAA
jgi:deaminated glutathione amidase